MSATAAPHRVQLKRTKGWKMPENTVKIDRTTRWGNPFTPADSGSVANAVSNHAAWMKGELAAPDGTVPPPVDEIRSALRGRHLACWCALDGPCHADLMLRIANEP